MARPGARYPQVEPTAAALIDRRTVDCPAAARVWPALERARAAGADVVVLGARRALVRADLERLVRWGLGDRRASEACWQDLPAIDARASEIAARRLVMSGAALLLVTRGSRVVGAIDGRGESPAATPPALSIAHRLDHALPGASEALPWLLRVAGKVGEKLGLWVFATGGFVRDLLLGRVAPDLDLVVEGDGIRYARQLADEVGGRVASHAAFGTASLEGAAGPGGVVLGRIDVASARAERYERPGALPVVRPARIDQDLRRRDFAINAMAVALHPSAFGRLLDPHGGQRDLACRRLRPLSPLSFVEDPTRLFRAARYAARLGFHLDPASAPSRRLALSTRFDALSGERLRAEIELLAAEPRRRQAFGLLLAWGVLAIVDRALGSSPRAQRLVADADRLLAWASRRSIQIDATETFLTALLAGRSPSVVGRVLERLSIRGEPAYHVAEASRAARAARQLSVPRISPSEISRVLEGRAVQAAAGIWLGGGPRVRRRVEWFLRHGRGIRPRLSGADVVALGVRRGPDVGECLAALRWARLDGRLGTVRAEERFVEQWQRGRETVGGEVLGHKGRNRARKGGVR